MPSSDGSELSSSDLEIDSNVVRNGDISSASKLRDSIKTYGSNSYYYAHSRSAEFVVPENAQVFEAPGVITGGSPVKLSVGEPVALLGRIQRKIEKYSWCDDEDKVRVYIEDSSVLPHITTSSELVTCTFDVRSFVLAVRLSDAVDLALNIAELCEEIDPAGSSWKVSLGKRISVTLKKRKPDCKWHSLRKK